MADKKPLILNAQGEPSQMKTGDTLGTANGGTGATTPAGARTNLGLDIGTNVQAWSNSLDAIAALASNGITVRTGAGAYASRSIIQPAAGITVTNGDGVAGNPTIALANDLAALEGLAGTGFAVRTTTDTWAQRTITGTAGRTTVTDGGGVAANPVIDLATLADGGGGTLLKFTRDAYGRVSGTSSVAALDLTTLLDSQYLRKDGGTMTNFITLHADPTNPLHAVTKQYADAIAEGRRDKDAVVAMVATNINVSNPGTATFDTVVLSNGQRLLLVGQTAQAENGPWLFNGSGAALTRPNDWNSNADILSGATFFVDQGATYSDSSWTLISSGPYVLGTTALVFTQTSSLGQITNGNGLNKTGNTLSVNLTARLTFNGGAVDLATTGVSAGTFTKYTTDIYGRIVGTGSATAADVGAQASSTELTGLAALNTTGLVARTSAGTYAPRTLTAPAAGLTIANADGVASNPTFALANDLAALEALAGTGIPVRTGADAWTQRSVVGTAQRIDVTNGNGVAGDITIDLLTIAGLTPGTYNAANVTVDAYGRVTGIVAGSASGQFNQSTVTNAEASTVAKCTAVYTDASGSVRKANANAEGTSKVQGLYSLQTNAAASNPIITAGELTATTGEWDAVTGQTGGLTVNANYFLDNVTAGKITTTVPASGFLVQVGRAISTTTLIVRIGQRIEL